MKDIIKGIWNDKFSRYLFIVLFVAGVFLLISPGEEQTNGDELAVHFFYHPNCPHCHEQKDFHKTLIERFPDIRIVEYDVSSPENSARLMEFAQKAGVSGLGVPATFFGDYHFVGFRSADTSGRDIENALEKFLAGESGEFEAPGSPRLIALPLFGEIDPLGFSLPVLAVVLGLVDGFNPCAMWVLVYLISLAMTMKSRRRMWLIIGTFVLASGILYFLFMTAWLNAFLFMGYVRPITIIIGLSALGFGISNLKTFFTTKGALACDVGDINSKKEHHGKNEEGCPFTTDNFNILRDSSSCICRKFRRVCVLFCNSCCFYSGSCAKQPFRTGVLWLYSALCPHVHA
jgi:glutaredoxin